MTRPHPLVEPRSFSTSTREVTFFNPAVVPPSALTPGLTPFPDSKSAALSSSGNRPWVVTPPPTTGLKTKLEEARGASSSCGWFKRHPSGRGLCSMALAFLLGAVLIFVALGVSATDATNMLMFWFQCTFGTVQEGGMPQRPTHHRVHSTYIDLTRKRADYLAL